MRCLDSITDSMDMSLTLIWRRKWQTTPVSFSGEFHGQRSLVGYSPWGCKELDMTERLTHTHTHTHPDQGIHKNPFFGWKYQGIDWRKLQWFLSGLSLSLTYLFLSPKLCTQGVHNASPFLLIRLTSAFAKKFTSRISCLGKPFMTSCLSLSQILL